MQEINQKIEFHKKMARMLEFSIWFLIVVLIVSIAVGYNLYSQKNYSRYQIFLQDADGIIEGSPVRMLGISVGYVKHIKFINGMVFVDFIINKKGVDIPKGSKITVEYSGLAGSKSLEIYVPRQQYDNNMPALVIQQPRRLGASISLLQQMFKKIGDIMYRCTYFSNSLEFDKLKDTNSNHSEKQILKNVDNWLEKQNNEDEVRKDE